MCSYPRDWCWIETLIENIETILERSSSLMLEREALLPQLVGLLWTGTSYSLNQASMSRLVYELVSGLIPILYTQV